MHDTGGFTSSTDTSSHTSHTSHMSPSSGGMPMDQHFPAPTLNPVDYGGGFTASSGGGVPVGLMIAIAAGILLPIVLSLVAFLAVG
jgi:hypothetical protein